MDRKATIAKQDSFGISRHQKVSSTFWHSWFIRISLHETKSVVLKSKITFSLENFIVRPSKKHQIGKYGDTLF